MSPDYPADLARLRAIAAGLPGTAEKLSHGSPCFFIEKGKAFAYIWHDHHGDGETAVMVKTGGADQQEALIAADPGLYYRPPYLGPSGWIAMRVGAPDTDWAHVADKVAESWAMVAPRRLTGMISR